MKDKHMKFLTKVNRNYIFLLMPMLIIVSIGGYFLLRHIILYEAKENLLDKEFSVEKKIQETGNMPNFFPLVEVKFIDQQTNVGPTFKIIYLNNETEDELEPYLEYSNQVWINGVLYSIKLRQATFEFEDLIFILTATLFILLLATFGVSFIISTKVNKTVWANFEYNLQVIEQFNFKQNSRLSLQKSNIEEFDRLNRVLETLTHKLKSDYLSLKEFTENASHEIQTPLSIALINLDELLQQDLTEDAFSKVMTTINSMKRLSTLSKSLILLTKIDNGQFVADETIAFNLLFNQKIIEFDALIKAKNLKVEKNSKQEFSIKISKQLAETLVNNLLSNAINHNIQGGTIQVTVDTNGFEICNTGTPNNLNNETIFNRFSKGNSKTFGLGLAIVKDICETNDLAIHYTKSDFHCFQITKNSNTI